MEKENIVFMTESNYRRIVAMRVSGEEINKYLDEWMDKVGDRNEVERIVKEKYGGELKESEVKSLLIQNLITYLVDETFKNKIGFLNMGDIRGMTFIYKLLENEFDKDGIVFLKQAKKLEDTQVYVIQQIGYPVYHLYEDCKALEKRKMSQVLIPKEVHEDFEKSAEKYVEEQYPNESESKKENQRKIYKMEKIEEYRKWWLEKGIGGKSLMDQLEEEAGQMGDISDDLRDRIKMRHNQKWHCGFEVMMLSAGKKVSIVNDSLKELTEKINTELLKYDELCEHYPVLVEKEKSLYKEIERIREKQEESRKKIEISPQENAFLQADKIKKLIVTWLKRYMQIKLNPDLKFDRKLLESLNCKCCAYCKDRRDLEQISSTK